MRLSRDLAMTKLWALYRKLMLVSGALGHEESRTYHWEAAGLCSRASLLVSATQYGASLVTRFYFPPLGQLSSPIDLT